MKRKISAEARHRKSYKEMHVQSVRNFNIYPDAGEPHPLTAVHGMARSRR